MGLDLLPEELNVACNLVKATFPCSCPYAEEDHSHRWITFLTVQREPFARTFSQHARQPSHISPVRKSPACQGRYNLVFGMGRKKEVIRATETEMRVRKAKQYRGTPPKDTSSWASRAWLWHNWLLSGNTWPQQCCKCRRNRPHLLPWQCCSRRRLAESSGPLSQTEPAQMLQHSWAPGGWLQACTWGYLSPGGLGWGETGWSESTQDTPVCSPGYGGKKKKKKKKKETILFIKMIPKCWVQRIMENCFRKQQEWGSQCNMIYANKHNSCSLKAKYSLKFSWRCFFFFVFHFVLDWNDSILNSYQSS